MKIMVYETRQDEQAELDRCAHKAKIILAKTGESLTYAQYRAEMEG